MLQGYNLMDANVLGGPANNGFVNDFQLLRDPGMRRPFFDDHGQPCVIVNTGRWTTEKGERKPIRERHRVLDLLSRGYVDPVLLTANATSLRKEQWIQLDTAIHKAFRARLRAWADLAAANTYGGFNGMGKMTLEYEAMSDPGYAIVDMDAMTEERADSPLNRLRSLPLPITHGGFWFSQRRLEISRGSDTPLDTIMGEAVARRIGETVEMTTIGTQAGINYGDQSGGITAHDTTAGTYTGTPMASTVYGYINYPHRITKTGMDKPTKSTWHPGVLVNDVLACLELLRENLQYGPFIVYNSTDWDQYLDNDYYREITGGSAVAPSKTLRQRIREIDGINDMRRLDFLVPAAVHKAVGVNPFTMVFVDMSGQSARAVQGMDITTTQWPSAGGMRQNFKIFCIKVPQMMHDYNGRTGILQATWTVS
jgi:hypothetical protein